MLATIGAIACLLYGDKADDSASWAGVPDVAREACHRTSAGTATLTSGGECGPVSTTSMTRSGRSSAVAQLEHVPDPDRLRDVADAEVVAPRVITVYAPPAPTSDDA
jgi:hypothetical protein